jgi:electron transfer flavoprotein beta subunit
MGIKIAVLVKQVPDHEAIIQVKSATELEIEDRWVCSFYDEIAMEAALSIKKEHPDTELVALSAGGRRAADALRRAVAMGIDRVERVGDESLDSAQSLLVAEALAARLMEHRPDLVLCGKLAGHDDQAAVGPMLAEFLDIPHVSAAVSLQVDPAGRKARAGRKVEGGIWTIESDLPLLVSAEKGLAEPHIPVVTRVMKAMKAKIENFPAGVEREDSVRRLGYFPPPSRPPVKMMTKEFPDNVAELIGCLRETGALS